MQNDPKFAREALAHYLRREEELKRAEEVVITAQEHVAYCQKNLYSASNHPSLDGGPREWLELISKEKKR